MQDREPIPFDEAMRRMLNAPPKPRKRGKTIPKDAYSTVKKDCVEKKQK